MMKTETHATIPYLYLTGTEQTHLPNIVFVYVYLMQPHRKQFSNQHNKLQNFDQLTQSEFIILVLYQIYMSNMEIRDKILAVQN